jgi:hypothetical protein
MNCIIQVRSTTPRIGESGSRLSAIEFLKEVRVQVVPEEPEKGKAVALAVQVIYMHVFARYSLKLTFGKH